MSSLALWSFNCSHSFPHTLHSSWVWTCLSTPKMQSYCPSYMSVHLYCSSKCFPTGHDTAAMHILSTFSAWLNLDLGIKIRVFNGVNVQKYIDRINSSCLLHVLSNNIIMWYDIQWTQSLCMLTDQRLICNPFTFKC